MTEPESQAVRRPTSPRTQKAGSTHTPRRTPAAKPEKQGRSSLTLLTAIISALLAGGLMAWGGWRRRWISDDGLIVLRTVRNLMAGNGPVFNAGERVEANTSVLWQYLIYVATAFTDARLEIIALWLALTLTTLALVIGVLGTAHMYRHNRALVLLPIGAIVYIAMPVARDFATSGLEWGLSLFWLAVAWALLAAWATPVSATDGRRHGAAPSLFDQVTLYGLAFWAGLSWLVRPELVLYGGLIGVLLLASVGSHRQRLRILGVAIPLPLAYQICRMGYYGLLTPHTAVAKAAGDARWSHGWDYFADFHMTYTLWVATVAMLIAAAVVLLRSGVAIPGERAHLVVANLASPSNPAGQAGARKALIQPGPLPAAAVFIAAALMHGLYVVGVGGDFMHGRMLLLPTFALLLPVMVVPVIDLVRRSHLSDAVICGAAAVVAVWALLVVRDAHVTDWSTYDPEHLTIVDERDYWTFNTARDKNDPPLVATDFSGAPAMNTFVKVATEASRSDAGMMTMYELPSEERTKVAGVERTAYAWTTVPRADDLPDYLEDVRPTVYFVNLGMTSMNAPLDVRVLDTIGLATPLAARMPQEDGGRIGHDRNLPMSWQAADTATDLDELPVWLDEDEAKAARAALDDEDFAKLREAYRGKLTVGRFFSNIAFALGPGRTLEFSSDPADYH